MARKTSLRRSLVIGILAVVSVNGGSVSASTTGPEDLNRHSFATPSLAVSPTNGAQLLANREGYGLNDEQIAQKHGTEPTALGTLSIGALALLRRRKSR